MLIQTCKALAIFFVLSSFFSFPFPLVNTPYSFLQTYLSSGRLCRHRIVNRVMLWSSVSLSTSFSMCFSRRCTSVLARNSLVFGSLYVFGVTVGNSSVSANKVRCPKENTSSCVSYFGTSYKASGGIYDVVPGALLSIRSLEGSTIIALPRSAILACSVGYFRRTFLAVRSR